jgi:hypothetical protein
MQGPRLIEAGLLVLERKLFKKNECIYIFFCYHIPLEKGGFLYLNELETTNSPSPRYF